MAFEVDLDKLEKAFSILVGEMRGVVGNKFRQDKYINYWSVPENEMFFLDKPQQLCVGDLRDDWKTLESILEDDSLEHPVLLSNIAYIILAIAHSSTDLQIPAV
jgi:hypothetical protein